MNAGTNGLLDGAREFGGDGVRTLRTRPELLAIEAHAEKALEPVFAVTRASSARRIAFSALSAFHLAAGVRLLRGQSA
jgi:hypothetical protein